MEQRTDMAGANPAQDIQAFQEAVSEGRALISLVEKGIRHLEQKVTDLTSGEAKDAYSYIRNVFLEPRFDLLQLQDFADDMVYQGFSIVRKHDFEALCDLVRRKLIVSVTTYPARIGTLDKVLDTIYAQTHPADEVVLWLAQEQFPGREADLPERLRSWIAEGKLTLRWCDDLKPHKKYFYALQEYTEDVVVTIDDDMVYSENLLERLWRSYLSYPKAVSAGRAHLMVLSEEGKILPYDIWARETDACIHQPSMQLLAVGCGGVLYPGGLFRKEFFDKEAVAETCLWADDLWLKAMEVVSDVPVVVAQPYETVPYVPGTQATALYLRNVDQNQNDIQLKKISQWLDAHIENGIFERKLAQSENGMVFRSVESICRHFGSERKALKATVRRLNEERAERWKELQELRKNKSERWKELQELRRERDQLKALVEKYQKGGVFSDGTASMRLPSGMAKLISKMRNSDAQE